MGVTLDGFVHGAKGYADGDFRRKGLACSPPGGWAARRGSVALAGQLGWGGFCAAGSPMR